MQRELGRFVFVERASSGDEFRHGMRVPEQPFASVPESQGLGFREVEP
jgi:hypothetical protein